MENLSDWPDLQVKAPTSTESVLIYRRRRPRIVLLADSARYTAYQDLFHNADPFDQLTEQLLRENRRFDSRQRLLFSVFACLTK
jgi:hypothetical protein